MSAEILRQIAKEVSECTKCKLCKGRTKTVPGEGSAEAKILFIGEAPGYHEDQQGRPFVGPSGQLLDRMLAALKMKREDVFIGNVVKCRPPENRDPQEDEIAACKPYLDRQIAAINPRLIVTLGRFSMRRWFPTGLISQLHGKPKAVDGRMIMPMFHPAAALRDRDRTYPMFREDALTIPAVLQKAEELAMAEIWNVPVESPTPPPVQVVTTPPSPPETVVETVAVPETVIKPEKPARKKPVEKVIETAVEQPTEPVIVTPELEVPAPQVETLAENVAVPEEKPVPKPKTTRKKSANPPAEQMTMF